jgi:hypothetical protein
MHGMGGNDSLDAGWGEDKLYGGAGDDHLFGEGGSDYLLDREGHNILYGGAGVDVVQGGAGWDYVEGNGGADVLETGGGNDLIYGGGGGDWIAAGQGNDRVETGADRNLVAFNRGDGADTLHSHGYDALSLGRGIRYADLRLTKSGDDLVLAVGQGESVTLDDWYIKGAGRRVDTLQVVTVGGDYAPAGGDVLRDQKVERFDFARIVQAFDQARAQAAANATDWAVMNSLLDAHLGGSDAQALGGDLSYQYATTGSLTGIGLESARSMAGAGAGAMQALRPRAELETSAVRLA